MGEGWEDLAIENRQSRGGRGGGGGGVLGDRLNCEDLGGAL